MIFEIWIYPGGHTVVENVTGSDLHLMTFGIAGDTFITDVLVSY